MRNIVWLVSYPKSGNTWFRIFLTNYLESGNNPVDLNQIRTSSIGSSALDFESTIGLDPFELTIEEIEGYRPTVFRSLSEDHSSGLLYKKAHDAYTLNSENNPIFPTDITFKALYFVRNPLDVCVSYANHSATSCEIMINIICSESTIIGRERGPQLRQRLLSWSGHVKSWLEQAEIEIMPIRYEDLKTKPIETFSRIIKFLELDYDESRVIKAIGFCDFKLLQQMEQEKGFKERKEVCQQFFWNGTIGNYRKHLTQEQVDRIVKYHYDTMLAFNYINNQDQLTV
jgi:hypothetical protein